MSELDHDVFAQSLLEQLQDLEVSKAELEKQLKAVTEAIAETKKDVIEQMELGNMASCVVGGRQYYCKQEFKATPTIDKEELVRAFQENGLEDKILRYVHPGTLSSFVQAEMKGNHCLPIWLRDKVDIALVKKLQSKKVDSAGKYGGGKHGK